MPPVYPGTSIEWMPQVVYVGLRVFMWAACILGCILIVRVAIKYHPPIYVILARAALFGFMAQQAILQAERIGQPLTYETLMALPAILMVFGVLYTERHAPWRQAKR